MPAPFLELDLHGSLPEAQPIAVRIREAGRAAQRSHRGLRIIHGRGAGVLARIVQNILEERGVEFTAGVVNPGETRIDSHTVQRHNWG